ncbi:MAG TPA: 4-hydroxy-tetrahydrodipicolinate synthase [Verrucomicrobiae bacterium]|nr:4-hydroxy-tetrahydrodipicolinate synthase [Verrucomicrobiae bacterium]
MSRLGTILTAMITPFDESGNLDSKEAASIARWLVDRGNDGLVVAGTTGEGATLDSSERRKLFAAVKTAIGKDAAMIANVGTNDVRSTVRGGQEAQEAGADALLVVVPPYVKPTQGGMLEFFGAVADATPLPVIIYNIPGRTAANMLPATLIELAKRHQNIAGVKESSGDLKQIATIVRDRPANFIVWSGDDHLFLPSLAVGADGVVGVATHLCSREYREMFRAFRNGDVARAATIHNGLLELVDALFAVTSPIAIKWAMGELGFKVGRCRPPLDQLPLGLIERLRPLLATYLTTA